VAFLDLVEQYYGISESIGQKAKTTSAKDAIATLAEGMAKDQASSNNKPVKSTPVDFVLTLSSPERFQ
jgi:hypothetical protein